MTETVNRPKHKTGAGAGVFPRSDTSAARGWRGQLGVLCAMLCVFQSVAQASLPSEGPLRLAPLQGELTQVQVKHLASRAGFGATQGEIDALTGLSAAQALTYFVGQADASPAPAFEHSGIFD